VKFYFATSSPGMPYGFYGYFVVYSVLCRPICLQYVHVRFHLPKGSFQALYKLNNVEFKSLNLNKLLKLRP
jgi:hypothetical protein